MHTEKEEVKHGHTMQRSSLRMCNNLDKVAQVVGRNGCAREFVHSSWYSGKEHRAENGLV